MQIDAQPELTAASLRTSPEERRRWLLERLRRDGRLVAAALAQELDTSEDTIRRDLRELAAAGRVQRVHGGALPPSPALLPLAARRERATEAKERLASAALALIREGQVLLLDGGTTNLALAQRLPPTLRLTVVTPSPAIALALAEHPGVELVLLGGRLDRASQTVVGAAAIDAVRSVRPDLCILGVCSLAAEIGVSVAGYEEAELKRAMAEGAREVAALLTTDKLATAAPFLVGPIDLLHRIVTERDAPDDLLSGFSDRGITILRS
ncbi:MAG: DeoR/GlpR family DNA-binding transcription regulator [Geminicoccaceae bacterium]